MPFKMSKEKNWNIVIVLSSGTVFSHPKNIKINSWQNLIFSSDTVSLHPKNLEIWQNLNPNHYNLEIDVYKALQSISN